MDDEHTDESVTHRQLADLQAGLLDDAEAAIAQAPPLSRIAWEHAHVYRRDSPTVISIGQQLGLSEADMDELFKTAASITA